MRFLALYLTLGIGWVFYNVVYVSLKSPRIGERLAEKFRHPWSYVGALISALLWPASLLVTIFPFAFGEKFRRWMFRAFRREYVDGPKWQRTLADPPPKLRTHAPALGCDGDHDWYGPDCACLVTCPTCGTKVPTPEFRAWAESQAGPVVSGPEYENR